ncbi:hypothetical protein ACLOJK_040601 [Asimina triloba]
MISLPQTTKNIDTFEDMGRQTIQILPGICTEGLHSCKSFGIGLVIQADPWYRAKLHLLHYSFPSHGGWTGGGMLEEFAILIMGPKEIPLKLSTGLKWVMPLILCRAFQTVQNQAGEITGLESNASVN